MVRLSANKTVKRFAFDVDTAIPAAWDLLWGDNLRVRLKEGKTMYRLSTTFYLTASDVEAQVRQFAEETMAGEKWGTRGRAYGRGYGSTIRLSGNLNNAVRCWLRDQVLRGKLESHNFGRGHISGARFRPVGQPISPSEETTFKAKERRRDAPALLHFGRRHGLPVCTANRRRSLFARPNYTIRCTEKLEEVTCPRCKKLAPKETGLGTHHEV